MFQSIIVRHNVEMAHRLFLQPDSKCHNIHGHSWWVDLELVGPIDNKGMVCGLDFGRVKQIWRGYLDTMFDHKCCLNETDTVGGGIPGLVTVPCDPTVENMARIWGDAAVGFFGTALSSGPPDLMHRIREVRIKVSEASTNAATWRKQF